MGAGFPPTLQFSFEMSVDASARVAGAEVDAQWLTDRPSEDNLEEYSGRFELCGEMLSNEGALDGAQMLTGVGPGSPMAYVSFVGPTGRCISDETKDTIIGEATSLIHLEAASSRCTDVPGS